jgi:hypothetical protein
MDVHGMIDVQDQAFAAVEKPKPEKVVVDKCCHGIRHAVPQKCGKRLAGSSALVEKLRNL